MYLLNLEINIEYVLHLLNLEIDIEYVLHIITSDGSMHDRKKISKQKQSRILLIRILVR